MNLSDLRPGDITFGPIGGLVPGVFPVGAGQLLLADRKARLSWRKWWKYRHVAVVVEAAVYDDRALREVSGPRIVQAMPHGAEEIEIDREHWTSDYVYVRPAYDGGISGSREQMLRVAYAARQYVGTPYNFLTYGKLAAGRFGLVFSEALLRKWISSRRDMMCSQLADQALGDADWHVFDDNRFSQDVVPAELFRAMTIMPGTRLLFPGMVEPILIWPDGSWGPSIL